MADSMSEYRPASLAQHIVQAEHAWWKLRDASVEIAHAEPVARAQVLAEVRKDAARTFWLYPLIEALRGLPA